jgi:WD40 repeat protein
MKVLWLLVRAGTVNALSFSADQQLLFSASSDSTVRLWSTELRKGLAAFRCGGSFLAVV